jgi:hypothetical protein
MRDNLRSFLRFVKALACIAAFALVVAALVWSFNVYVLLICLLAFCLFGFLARLANNIDALTHRLDALQTGRRAPSADDIFSPGSEGVIAKWEGR